MSDVQGITSSTATFPGSLAQRAADLKAEAISAIKQAQDDEEKAEHDRNAAIKRKRQAVVDAVELGIPRKDIAEAVGVSASWVSNLVRAQF
jgi:FixJ family two-component response regulator